MAGGNITDPAWRPLIVCVFSVDICISNGADKMGFPDAYFPVEKKWVVFTTGVFRHCLRQFYSKVIGFSRKKVVERQGLQWVLRG